VSPAGVRIAAGILATAAVALAGCGGREPVPVASSGSDTLPPAYDPQRTADLPRLTTADAVRTSPRIALVVARGSHVIAAPGGTPFTRTAFSVERVLKGRLPHRFVLQVIGGRLGNSVVTSPVAPFRPAVRYIVFLGYGPAGPTIAPQATIAVHTGAQLRRALARIRRYVP
jgi:hypothetical protein